jgi:HSP20 family protein
MRWCKMRRRRERPPFWFEETFDRIRRLEEEFHRMLSDFWRAGFGEFPEFRLPRIRIETEAFGSMPVDVSETKDEVIVRADLPGFSKDEIKLKATQDELIIEAGKREEKEERAENYFRQERRWGAVRRVIPLPVPVIPEKARAKFENGVLEVRLPKQEPEEEEEEKEIKIE